MKTEIIERRCKRNEDSTPWCPLCGDSLTEVECMREDLSSIYGEVNDHYEYYCIGCDKNFVFKVVS